MCEKDLKFEVLRLEYECAQQSAQHYNTIVWTIATVVLGAVSLLLREVLSAVSARVYIFVGLISLVLLIGLFFLVNQQLSYRTKAYDRCKVIQNEIKSKTGVDMKLHTDSCFCFPLVSGSSVLFSIILILFLFALVVFVYGICLLT